MQRENRFCVCACSRCRASRAAPPRRRAAHSLASRCVSLSSLCRASPHPSPSRPHPPLPPPLPLPPALMSSIKQVNPGADVIGAKSEQQRHRRSSRSTAARSKADADAEPPLEQNDSNDRQPRRMIQRRTTIGCIVAHRGLLLTVCVAAAVCFAAARFCRHAVNMSITAGKSLADILRTNLGPRGTMKM